jgi:predicted dehydrogenase
MINWGIIGCGNVTEVKSGPAFNKVSGSRLAAVMRRNIKLAEDYAARHNVPKSYGDADSLINDPEIDAVYVATPPGSHAEYAIKAIKAGKPVYIEKPMAAKYAECIEINRAAKKYRVPVFVAYYRRALPGFLKVRELITSGRIGNARAVSIQLFKSPSDEEKSGKLPWRVDPEIAGGGHFYDLASHQLDYLDFLFGPVEKIKSAALNAGRLYKAEDFVAAQFIFSGGIVCNGMWCFSLSPDSNRDIIEIFGEKGTIKFSTFSFEPIILTGIFGTREFVNERPENVQFCLIENIVRSLEGKETPISTGISGARTSSVLEKTVAEYYKGSRNK